MHNNKENSHFPAKFFTNAKNVVINPGVINFFDLGSESQLHLNELPLVLKVAADLALLGLIFGATARASEFSHHSQKHERNMEFAKVGLWAAATALFNYALWK